MPSWNIHIAQTEALLAEYNPAELGIRDANAFLFGNLVPDIYVGYMVPNPSRLIPYADTHFTDPSHIPEPNYQLFWDEYALPSADVEGHISDMVLGAWAHLVADNHYNHRVNAEVQRLGLTICRELRIRKQGDFDLFGRTLDITLVPEATPELIAAAEAFPQYAIAEVDTKAAVEVAQNIVENNRVHHVAGTPAYSFLTAEFFEQSFAAVNATVAAGLKRWCAA